MKVRIISVSSENYWYKNLIGEGSPYEILGNIYENPELLEAK